MLTGRLKRASEWVESIVRDGRRPFRSSTGEIITDALAEEIAREAETGYDIDSSLVRPRGRPTG